MTMIPAGLHLPEPGAQPAPPAACGESRGGAGAALPWSDFDPRCEDCGGDGYDTVEHGQWPRWTSYRVGCPECDGTGMVRCCYCGEPCDCDGFDCADGQQCAACAAMPGEAP